MQTKPKIIVVLGPTATGKSDLAVKLARKFDGEIISADSRQVYRGLDLGSGKITEKEMRGIPHHLLDIISPKNIFSAARFKKIAEKKIKEILARKKLPIIVGGTGYYIQSIVDNVVFPDVPQNKKLRKELSKKSTDELFAILKTLDKERSLKIDKKNRVRLVRAIEIAKKIGKVPDLKKNESRFDVLQIGIDMSDQILKEKINSRLLKRIKQGMIKEVENLNKTGLSWKRLESFGLEYRYASLYLQNKISKEEMINYLKNEIWHFVKRQRTWFKKGTQIIWFNPVDTEKIKKEIIDFIKK